MGCFSSSFRSLCFGLALFVVVDFAALQNTTFGTIATSGDAAFSKSLALVGNTASGFVSIGAGESVSMSRCDIGVTHTGVGTVTMSDVGTSWAVRGIVNIGCSGTGTVEIGSGALLSLGTGSICLGEYSNSVGILNINSGGSLSASSVPRIVVGDSGIGTMEVHDGASLVLRGGGSAYNGSSVYIGGENGGVGTLKIDSGSSFSLASMAGKNVKNNALYVGYLGTGTLELGNGVNISVDGTTAFGYCSGSKGKLSFGSSGTLSTVSLYASSSQVSGTGTINAKGLVSDINLVFGTTSALTQTITFNSLSGQSVTLDLDMSVAANNGDLGAGYAGTGSLTIKNGVSITSASGYIGFKAGSSGTATIDGAGSVWNVSGDLSVGYLGAGLLHVTNGGTVNVHGAYVNGTAIIDHSGILKSPAIRFNGGTSSIVNGGTLNTSSVVAATNGVLTVGNGGVLKSSDIGVSGGVINVVNGGVATASSGSSVSFGLFNVSGSGSSLQAGGICVSGGELAVTNGGVAVDAAATSSSMTTTCIGHFGAGTILVSGSGSLFTTTRTLQLGSCGTGTLATCGTGTLAISNGGMVSAASVSISSQSLLYVDIGYGSSLVVGGGTGTITNSGAIMLHANATAPAGTYTPIYAGEITGTGVVEVFGGTWNTSAKTFTVSSAVAGTVGSAASINLNQSQRITFTDSSGNNLISASFSGATCSSSSMVIAASKLVPAASSSAITVTPTALSTEALAALQTSLESGGTILTGFMFETTGYVEGTPVYLSLKIGEDQYVGNLTVWHYDGTTWTEYDATDLTYDGTYANFTVTGFSGYAIVAVPEPAALALFAVGLLGLFAYVWRKRC